MIFQINRYCTLLVLYLLFASGCTSKHWENQGDSCVFTASEPPLRRVSITATMISAIESFQHELHPSPECAAI